MGRKCYFESCMDVGPFTITQSCSKRKTNFSFISVLFHT